jgi:hypothetical protein
MEKIDIQNFKKYYRNNDGNGTVARVGHVNAVIEELNNLITESAGGYIDLGNSSQTTNVDWSQGETQELNLDNNPTLTFTNAESGDSLSLLLKSDTTQRNVNWPSNVRWNRGVVPTIARVLQNGAIDSSFLSGTGFTDSMGLTNTRVGICYVLSTGKILIWNNAHQSGTQRYNGTTLPDAGGMNMGNRDLIRLNADGTLDTTWSTNQWALVASTMRGVKSILELPDGRILVGGDFLSAGMPGTYGNAHLQLLSADGVRDNTFQPSIGAFAGADGVNVITRQSNGKIIIAGFFQNINMITTHSIARFNSNLTLDTGFTASIGDAMSYVTVNTLDIDSNDSIFIGTISKEFPVNGSGSYNNLVALDANGAILSGFSQTYFPPYSGNMDISNIKILINNTTNRITVCWTPIGNGQTGIVRFLPNGTVDSSFNVGTGLSFGPNGNIKVEMIALPGNKILVLGDIFSFNGTPVSRICAINNNGGIDTSINIPSSGFNLLAVQGLLALNAALQVNGDILVTGPFSTYGGATANAIVSINLSTDTEMYTKIDFKYTGVNYIGSF